MSNVLEINLTGNQISQHTGEPSHFPELYKCVIEQIEDFEKAKNKNVSLKDFISMIEKTAELLEKYHACYINKLKDSGNSSCEEIERNKKDYAKHINVFKGDIFEVFAEVFFGIPGFTSHIENYKCITENDFGVDGFGKAKNSNPEGFNVAVQVKYRKNLTEKITWEDLAKTAAIAFGAGFVDAGKPKNIWLFTSSEGANRQAQNAFKAVLNDNLRVIGRKEIDNTLKKHTSDSFFRVHFVPAVKRYFLLHDMHDVKNFKERLPQ